MNNEYLPTVPRDRMLKTYQMAMAAGGDQHQIREIVDQLVNDYFKNAGVAAKREMAIRLFDSLLSFKFQVYASAGDRLHEILEKSNRSGRFHHEIEQYAERSLQQLGHHLDEYLDRAAEELDEIAGTIPTSSRRRGFLERLLG